MSIHKSDGIKSKKGFKKHNSIEKTKVTMIIDDEDDFFEKDDNDKVNSDIDNVDNSKEDISNKDIGDVEEGGKNFKKKKQVSKNKKKKKNKKNKTKTDNINVKNDNVIVFEDSSDEKDSIEKKKDVLISTDNITNDEHENLIKEIKKTRDLNNGLVYLVLIVFFVLSIIVFVFIYYKFKDIGSSSTQSKLTELINEKKIDENLDAEDNKDNNIDNENNNNSENNVLNYILCDDTFLDKLAKCESFECVFFDDNKAVSYRRIKKKDDKCTLEEDISITEQLVCENLDDEKVKQLLEVYQKSNQFSIPELVEKFKKQENSSSDDSVLIKYLSDGICNIKSVSNSCVGGVKFMGRYVKDGNIIDICADSGFECEQDCDRCRSQKTKLITNFENGSYKCVQCSNDEDCSDDYHCYKNKCMSTKSLKNYESCSSDNDNCKKLACENCTEGVKYCNKGRDGWGEDLNNKCVDCTETKYCQDGYECIDYKCTKK